MPFIGQIKKKVKLDLFCLFMASILPAKTNYNFYRNRIMREERKNIYLITTFLSAALLGSLLLAASDYATSQNRWGVKIDSKLITKG